MTRHLLILLLPLSLLGFEPIPATSSPVLGYQEISFYDYASETNRKLLVWYPVDSSVKGTPASNELDAFSIAINAAPVYGEDKLPVVVISHGYGGNPHHLSWFIRGMVEANFIVIGIEHKDFIDGEPNINFWQRAADVGRMIDTLTISPLKNAVDNEKIVMAGFSLGGTTVIWVAGGIANKDKNFLPGSEYANPSDWEHLQKSLKKLDKEMLTRSWKDPRVKGAFVMAPAWSWIFDPTTLQQITIPIYIIAPENDGVLVTENNAGYFSRYIPGSIYRKIPGKANHSVFITQIDPVQQDADDSIDLGWIQAQVVKDAVDFFSFIFKETF